MLPALTLRLPTLRAAEWLTGGLHLLVLGGAAQVNSRLVWPYAIAAIAAISFFAWIGNFSRYRQIRDLPTSKIASAPQGYVGFSGRSMLISDETVTAPLSGQPCCWYRYQIEERSGRNWRTTEDGVSTSHFFVVDDTGRCYVAPEGAEVHHAHKKTWRDGDARYTEWLLLPRGLLYALGEFRTLNRGVGSAERKREVAALLTDWKADRPGLLKRFDANRDGEIDLAEWEAARRACAAEVEARHAESLSQGPEHVLCKPADGRVFLLSAAPAQRLGQRFAVWGGLHMAAFMVSVVGAYILFTAGPARG